VIVEVAVKLRKGRCAYGVALAGDYILRRIELSEMIPKQQRADSCREEGVCEVGRQAAQRVGGGRHGEACSGLARWCCALRGDCVHGQGILGSGAYDLFSYHVLVEDAICNIYSRHVYATDMGASNVVEAGERGWEEEGGIEVGR
jgi:hypothetical protein